MLYHIPFWTADALTVNTKPEHHSSQLYLYLPYYFLIADWDGIMYGFMPFPKALGQNETQTVSSI